MNNPLRIIETLDSLLLKDTDIILFGKAAITLGFPSAPAHYGSTMDVDAILPTNRMEAIMRDDQWWQAIDETNKLLAPEGLYITHLFEETQTILTPTWAKKTLKIHLPTKHLTVIRPSTIDLILTKMARGTDPQDMEDIQFLLAADNITPKEMEEAIHSARLPEVPEIHDLFEAAKPIVCQLVQRCLQEAETKQQEHNKSIVGEFQKKAEVKPPEDYHPNP